MGEFVKLMSYEVKLCISELLTWETLYSGFFPPIQTSMQSTHNATG